MLPTDRGIVAVRQEGDGTVTVLVCTEIHGDRPAGVYARHAGMPADKVHVDVPLRGPGLMRHTAGVAEVVWDPNGDLHIRPIPVEAGA
jgi:hypothetical protein